MTSDRLLCWTSSVFNLPSFFVSLLVSSGINPVPSLVLLVPQLNASTWMPSVPGCCSNLTVRVCDVFWPRPSCQVRLLPPARRGSW
ncbi:hypothetical protein AMECASPLE_018315 [Ameca splendens]|uniref:Secreted protein n=1 Tax=Ameca splendens TaxID=208324 RepID=A0ABV0Y2H4_9TELE